MSYRSSKLAGEVANTNHTGTKLLGQVVFLNLYDHGLREPTMGTKAFPRGMPSIMPGISHYK